LPENLTPEEARFNMWRWQWRRRIAIAQGQYPPATVLTGGTIVNVFTEELIQADVAIDAGVIVAIGSFPDARERIDVTGKFIAPSFIDAHIHIESSLLWIPEFARAVVPRGTGAVVTDPHEMANVAGITGINAMREAANGLPLHIAFTAPSSVPASPHESPGATFGLEEVRDMLAWNETVALGELMNLPGVLNADSGIAELIDAASTTLRDGHAPAVRGDQLQAYIAAGIQSDHESTTIEEAHEKLRLGLMLLLREGSSEKNLLELLPLVTDKTVHRFAFASDDRDCHDLLHSGHIDETLRIAVAAGLDPLRAIRLATLNPALHYRLPNIGAVAPGYRANLVVLDDLEQFNVAMTFFNGRQVAEAGQYIFEPREEPAQLPNVLTESVHLASLRRSHLSLDADSATQAVEVVPGQIVTRLIDVDPRTEGDKAIADPDRDLLKLVCVERHQATGRVGAGYVRGFGLQRGALASTIAHDAHNIIAIGVDDTDILRAISLVAESQGGLAVVADGEILGHLPLPIAGLMTNAPLEDVAASYGALEQTAKDLGSTLDSPFGTLAFMALSVIPEARVTDRGLLRVNIDAG
jgi:adenine deaminase